MERRKHQRHDLSAPVNFQWELADGTRREATGVSQNLSAEGLFVMTDDLPPNKGTAVDFELDLATARLGSGVNIRAKGEVCRVEEADLPARSAGFAIFAKRMRLEKPEPSE